MDNHHVQITNSYASCGILELAKLASDPERVAYALASHLYHPSRGNPAAFVLWSDVEKSNGELFKEFLARTFGPFGAVVTSESAENPKTSNQIRVFLWTIPHATLRSWYREQRVEKARKQ